MTTLHAQDVNIKLLPLESNLVGSNQHIYFVTLPILVPDYTDIALSKKATHKQ